MYIHTHVVGLRLASSQDFRLAFGTSSCQSVSRKTSWNSPREVSPEVVIWGPHEYYIRNIMYINDTTYMYIYMYTSIYIYNYIYTYVYIYCFQ